MIDGLNTPPPATCSPQTPLMVPADTVRTGVCWSLGERTQDVQRGIYGHGMVCLVPYSTDSKVDVTWLCRSGCGGSGELKGLSRQLP